MTASLALVLALAASPPPSAAPQTLDLTRWGIYATVEVPQGTEAQSSRDGYVILQIGVPGYVMIERGHLDYPQERVSLARFEKLTRDERGDDGEFLLAWDDHLNPPRRWRLRSLDHGRLVCRAGGDDVERADAICRSLKVRRTGEILRVVALDGPSIEAVGAGWRLTGRFRVERDGLPLTDAKLTVNGKALTPANKDPGTFELSFDGVEPRSQLRLEWAGAKTHGEVTLSCPGPIEVLRPRDGSDESPSATKWVPAPGAAKLSVEFASWDPVEKVALAGSMVGWAGPRDREMQSMIPDKPPYRVTFTAYGPESTGAQTPGLSCRFVQRVYTVAPRAP
jgi:hypothetical protein